MLSEHERIEALEQECEDLLSTISSLEREQSLDMDIKEDDGHNVVEYSRHMHALRLLAASGSVDAIAEKLDSIEQWERSIGVPDWANYHAD